MEWAGLSAQMQEPEGSLPCPEHAVGWGGKRLGPLHVTLITQGMVKLGGLYQGL